jgi:hypothetical protein
MGFGDGAWGFRGDWPKGPPATFRLIESQFSEDPEIRTLEYKLLGNSRDLSTSFWQTQTIDYDTTGMQTFSTTHPLYTPSALLDNDRAGRLRHRTVASDYRYDANGQVAVAHRKFLGEVPAGLQIKYGYDDIGNRNLLKEVSTDCLGPDCGPPPTRTGREPSGPMPSINMSPSRGLKRAYIPN